MSRIKRTKYDKCFKSGIRSAIVIINAKTGEKLK